VSKLDALGQMLGVFPWSPAHPFPQSVDSINDAALFLFHLAKLSHVRYRSTNRRRSLPSEPVVASIMYALADSHKTYEVSPCAADTC
jgi:hypothetical protein